MTALVATPFVALPWIRGVRRREGTAPARGRRYPWPGWVIRAQAADAAASAVRSVARSGTEVPLGAYQVAWGSGLASCSHVLLAMRHAATVPGTWDLMLLATLAFMAAVARVGFLVGRRAQGADRQPLLHDRPLVATGLAWMVFVVTASVSGS